jgi:hypothetical protein
MYIYIYVCVYLCVSVFGGGGYVCIYVYIYVCIHVCLLFVYADGCLSLAWRCVIGEWGSMKEDGESGCAM